MEIGFFLLKFSLSPETSVPNQIAAFTSTGYDVEIVALQKGDLENMHASFDTYRLGEKTRQLLDEPESKLVKLKYRATAVLRGPTCTAAWKALNVVRYGEETRNLILTVICGGNPQAFQVDVFIAHFGPAGVIATKLRELGMIRGRIATVFHGIDVSHRDMLAYYTPEYQQLFQRGDLMLPINNLWTGRPKNMGCSSQKTAVSRMGIDMICFSLHQLKAPATPPEIISVARLTEKKGLHVATEACRQLKKQGVLLRRYILDIDSWERRLRMLIEQYQLGDVTEMPGFKPNHQIKEVFEQAGVLLLPSIAGRDGDMGGIPVALMEAIVVRIPVISTVHSGIPKLVESGKSGWLAPENDAQALTERLAASSLLDSEQVQPIVQRTCGKIEKEFNQLATNRQLASLLQMTQIEVVCQKTNSHTVLF